MSRPVAFVHGAFGRLGLVDMDSDLATHVHHHLHVAIKAGGADTRFRVRDADCPVTDDFAVLVNAWEPHAWRRDPGAPPTRFLTLYLEPRWLAAAGFDAPNAGFGAFFPAPSVRLGTAARRTIGAIAEIMASPGRGPHDAAMGDQIAALVPDLIDTLRHAGGRRPRPAPIGGVFDYRIRRALGLLHDAEGPVRLDGVARAVGLSRPRFFELFHECTGVTPSRVVNAARMERAIGALTGGRSPLGDLALDLGFATPGNFSRFFRQQIGVSPYAFRRAAIPAESVPTSPPT
jgi:AraC family transcriptional regulator